MKPAFTLIELLVVVTIIALLAGLLLAGMGPLRRQLMYSATQTTLASLQGALEHFRAEHGALPAPVEHPWAASSALDEARFAWTHQDGSAVPTTGGVWRGPNVVPAMLAPPADAARLLRDNDRCADLRSPMLYGTQRIRATILGVALPEITDFRRLSASDPAAIHPTTAGAPVIGTATTVGIIQTLDLILASGGLRTELVRNGTYLETPDDLPVNLIHGHRAWGGSHAVTARRPGSTVVNGGTLSPYRLRGAGLYDAWGREILMQNDAAGGLRLESAGADGCFTWQPGADGIFQTAAESALAAGDDRDGQRDNPRVGERFAP